MKKLFVLFLLFINFQSLADEPFNTTVANGCVVNYGEKLYLKPVFEPNSFICDAGYYLPANTETCAICLATYDCYGGTFSFSEKSPQGLSTKQNISTNITNGCDLRMLRASNNSTNVKAIFTPNVHNCAQGYYLPANVDECTLCPLNHHCNGGTYTFNETTTQGITGCPSELPFAPMGSTVCYPHILHVGNDIVYLRSVKLTTPSLNIQIGNEVFYANMTTTPTYMSAMSEHYLKMSYDNTVYYVCDDTVYSNQ